MTQRARPTPAALLASLRQAPTDSSAYGAARERVQARLAASVAAGLGAALDRPSSFAPRSPAAAAAGGALKVAVSVTRAGAAAWLGLAFAVGVVAGVAGVAADRAHQRRVALPAESARPVPARPPEPSAPPALLAPPAQAEPAAPPPSSSRPAASAESGSTLHAEQTMLDDARGLLAHGEPAAALSPLERHAARFPSGILSEEREALAIRILVTLARDADALTRAEAFNKRFPNSLFRRTVDAAIAKIPGRNVDDEPKP